VNGDGNGKGDGDDGGFLATPLSRGAVEIVVVDVANVVFRILLVQQDRFEQMDCTLCPIDFEETR